ncbi:hypothetical protein QQZ08_012028 [Neonectria magnoliae]|uniref:SMODS and SLOG-associating 2TM effector domain-containing protein n=1 Tax=Neonectria magnoliae TaxID=2732573 RepID=A0ABR1H701_9HYPO
MSRHDPGPEPRHRRRRSSERGRSGPDAMQPRPYLVEWCAQTCRQRGLLDVDELREEMGAPERAGWRRLVVMRGSEAEMDMAVGVQLGDRRRGAGWAWEYPEAETKATAAVEAASNWAKGKDAPQGIRLCRASLSTKTRIPILLLDGLPPHLPSRPPRLSRHSHRRRTPSTSRTSDGRVPPVRSGLEDALWDGLGDGLPLEHLLAELAYHAWLDALDALPRNGDSVDVLRTLVRALETNADAARAMERRGRPAGVASGDWTGLAERLHRRMQLSATLSLQPAASKDSSNSRSLDRIAYLGGLLLPLTVVSGILSIEGTYGPEGSAFWVFWLAAGLSSIAALLVIYADHLRGLDVWMEVEASELLLHHHAPKREFQTAGGDAERGEARVTTAADGGVYVVQRRGDGSGGRAWRRKELGWVGAVKKMSGWYLWRGSPGIEFRMPGWEERVRDLVW